MAMTFAETTVHETACQIMRRHNEGLRRPSKTDKPRWINVHTQGVGLKR